MTGPTVQHSVPLTEHWACRGEVQARQVRQQAGVNVGQLAALSPRVDALAGDQLAASLHAAEPGLKVDYAAALRGLLDNAGGRLSAPVLSKLGGMLAATLATAGAALLMALAAADQSPTGILQLANESSTASVADSRSRSIVHMWLRLLHCRASRGPRLRQPRAASLLLRQVRTSR